MGDRGSSLEWPARAFNDALRRDMRVLISALTCWALADDAKVETPKKIMNTTNQDEKYSATF